jgi:hypothetical protein
LHAVGVQEEHRAPRLPVFLAKVLDLDVGIARTNVDVVCEMRKLEFEPLELRASLRITLDENVLVETRLRLQ